jgi:hypothetical protein
VAKSSSRICPLCRARSVGQQFIRWFFYLGFMVSSIGAITILGLGGPWWAPLFGCVVFGIPTVIAYITEAEHQQNIGMARINQQMIANSEGDDWELRDNDGGDPTVPPAPRERTQR